MAIPKDQAQSICDLYSTISECLLQQLEEIPNTPDARLALIHALAHYFAVVVNNGETERERLYLLGLGQRFLFNDLPICDERKTPHAD